MLRAVFLIALVAATTPLAQAEDPPVSGEDVEEADHEDEEDEEDDPCDEEVGTKMEHMMENPKARNLAEIEERKKNGGHPTSTKALLISFDEDKDGFTSEADIFALLSKAGVSHMCKKTYPAKIMKELVEEYDKDADGKLSHEELPNDDDHEEL